MKLVDIAVLDFHFYPGIKGPTIKAMAQFTFDELDETPITWVDLMADEIEGITIVARLVEHRFLSGETPIPTETKRQLGFVTPDQET